MYKVKLLVKSYIKATGETVPSRRNPGEIIFVDELDGRVECLDDKPAKVAPKPALKPEAKEPDLNTFSGLSARENKKAAEKGIGLKAPTGAEFLGE